MSMRSSCHLCISLPTKSRRCQAPQSSCANAACVMVHAEHAEVYPVQKDTSGGWLLLLCQGHRHALSAMGATCIGLHAYLEG